MAGMSKLSEVTTAMGVRNLQTSGDPKVLAAQGYGPVVPETVGGLTVVDTPSTDRKALDAARRGRRRSPFATILGNDGVDTLG